METIEEIKKQGIPLVICGAGIVGKALFYACQHKGIKVDGFCDSNINKTKFKLCGLEVIHTPQLKARFQDCIILISAADIKDVADQLHVLGHSRWYAGSLLLKDFDVSRGRFSKANDFVEYAVETCRLCQDSYLNPHQLFLRSVDIVITERCSLKCRDCANLMQYYEGPVNYSMEETLQSIDALCACVDCVNEFRVIGGEPFMNKEIHLVVRRLVDEPKVKRIAIYTNATILPRDEHLECFRSSKVLFMITDYNELSRNLTALTRLLDENRITYNAHKAERWTDSGEIRKHNRGVEDQKKIFTNCCAKNTLTLSRGELHRCPFSANALRLNAVPDHPGDYVQVTKGVLEDKDIDGTKQRIRRLVTEKTYLDTCDHCNGRSFDDPQIIPAIQTKKPLEYERQR